MADRFTSTHHVAADNYDDLAAAVERLKGEHSSDEMLVAATMTTPEFLTSDRKLHCIVSLHVAR